MSSLEDIFLGYFSADHKAFDRTSKIKVIREGGRELFFLCPPYLFIYLFWAALGLHCCARASHCGGFSCCGARALGTQASVVVARGLQ